MSDKKEPRECSVNWPVPGSMLLVEGVPMIEKSAYDAAKALYEHWQAGFKGRLAMREKENAELRTTIAEFHELVREVKEVGVVRNGMVAWEWAQTRLSEVRAERDSLLESLRLAVKLIDENAHDHAPVDKNAFGGTTYGNCKACMFLTALKSRHPDITEEKT